MATLKDQLAARQADSASRIGNLYDKQYETQRQSLQTAYDQNVSDLNAQRSTIGQTYQNSANQLAQQYERNRRNANLNAMTNGLNTGTAQQQQNALARTYTGNAATNRAYEAAAYAANDQNLAKTRQEFQNNLVAARANADNQKNTALVKDYTAQQEWADKQASLLASYGDFSGYADLYGQEQANSMRNTWISQNPDLAYRSGVIDKATYKKITGKDPTYKSIYA